MVLACPGFGLGGPHISYMPAIARAYFKIVSSDRAPKYTIGNETDRQEHYLIQTQKIG